MFPIEHAADLSKAQLWLLHWIQVYDWAYSLPEKERPSDAVIENDIRFDDWYKYYIAKRKAEARNPNGSRGSATKHDNVINFQ